MKAVVETVDGGCGTDTQKTQMTCIEMNFTNLRRSDTNQFMQDETDDLYREVYEA